MNVNSLTHTKWNCKYHIVFAVRGALTASLGYKDPDSMSLTLATVMGHVMNDEEFDKYAA